MQCNVNSHYTRLTALEVTYGRKRMQAEANTHSSYPAILLFGVFLLLLTVGGCKQKGGPPQGDPEVAVVTVHPERVVITTELPGRTSAFLVAEIRPQASGVIWKRLFTEGADVKAGDVLYEIDPSSYKAAYANAEAAVAVAKANQVSALAAVAAAKAGHATTLAARDAAMAALSVSRASQSRAEANAVPLRLRADRFRELVADKAVSQQDFDDVSAALKQAEAGIESAVAMVRGAEADIVRAEAAIQVAEAKIQSTEAAVQSAEAAIGSAEAGLETARINLGYTRIAAPIAGRIGRSAITTGALVTSHQPIALATIQQLDPIYVDVPQSTTELLRLQNRLKDGRLNHDGTNQNKVKLILEGGMVYPHKGVLQFQDVTVDPTTGSVILRVVFPNPKGILLPGMFVRAVIIEGVKEQAILVPQQGISRNPKGDPVALIVDAEDKVQQRMLTLDRAIGNKWLVSSGLEPGDRVIVEGVQKVRPGASVKVVPFAAGHKEGSAAEKAVQPSETTN